MSRLQSITRWGLRNLSNLSLGSTNVSGRRASCLASVSASKPPCVVGPQNLLCNPSISNQSLGASRNVLSRGLATKNDQDIVEFLADEIAAEKSNQKNLELPGSGFELKTEGAEVTFSKTLGSEKIVVTMNVNHTVDSAEPDDGSEEAPEMKSKPNFEVDIIKSNGKTVSFSCSFVEKPDMTDAQGQQQPEEAFDDLFGIDEVTMFEGENWDEKKYAVAGDILDGYLYDLFMNMLDERGINKEFVDKMSAYCSAYEHSLYISMLEDLQKFVK